MGSMGCRDNTLFKAFSIEDKCVNWLCGYRCERRCRSLSFCRAKRTKSPFYRADGAAFSLGLKARKIDAHATPSVAMVRYYTMAPSAATSKFFFTLSPPGRAKARGLVGDTLCLRSLSGFAGLNWPLVCTQSGKRKALADTLKKGRRSTACPSYLLLSPYSAGSV
jgi:hypothetical protein